MSRADRSGRHFPSRRRTPWGITEETHTDGSLLVKGQTCVDFCRDATGDNGEDLRAEFNEETIKSSARLSVCITLFGLAVLDSDVDELLIRGLVRRGEDERLEVDRLWLSRLYLILVIILSLTGLVVASCGL